MLGWKSLPYLCYVHLFHWGLSSTYFLFLKVKPSISASCNLGLSKVLHTAIVVLWESVH